MRVTLRVHCIVLSVFFKSIWRLQKYFKVPAKNQKPVKFAGGGAKI